MSTEVKLIPIGNSKGIRIPKALLLKYHLQEQIVIEEKENGLFIHSNDEQKLSWEETYKEIEKEEEDWSDWHAFEDIHEI